MFLLFDTNLLPKFLIWLTSLLLLHQSCSAQCFCIGTGVLTLTIGFFIPFTVEIGGHWPIKIIFWVRRGNSQPVKALNLCFPRVLCAKHVKDNAIDNLRKSLPQPEVTEIVSKLFGSSGILSSEDQVTFDELRDELTDTYSFLIWSSTCSGPVCDIPGFLDFGTTIVTSHTTMWSSGVLTGSSRNYPIWSQNCMNSNKTSRNDRDALHDTGKYTDNYLRHRCWLPARRSG